MFTLLVFAACMCAVFNFLQIRVTADLRHNSPPPAELPALITELTV